MRGTPPTAAPIPPPGTYWIREARPRYIPSVPATLTHPEIPSEGFTWDGYTTEWLIARVEEGGSYDVIASDEGFCWVHPFASVVVEVGPRLEPPSSYPITYGVYSDRPAMRCPHCQQIGYISELAPAGIPWMCPHCHQRSDGKTWTPA